MFMCDVTYLDNQRQDNSVWWPGYRQENQEIVVQFSGGNKFVSSPEHPDWPCKQPILLSSADQGLFLLWVKRLANNAEIKNEWRNTSTHISFYGVHRHNSYFQKSMGCTCRMQEERHKLFQAHRMKRTKALM
jgi:hypothetical protein